MCTTPVPLLIASVCTNISTTAGDRSYRTSGIDAIAVRNSRSTLGYTRARLLPHFWTMKQEEVRQFADESLDFSRLGPTLAFQIMHPLA